MTFETDLNPKQAYDEYVQFCILHGVVPLDIAHFDNDESDDADKEIADKHLLGFATGVSFNAGSLYNAAKHGYRRFRENKGDIKSTLNAIKGDAANYVGDVINDFVSGNSDVKINRDINGGGGGFDNKRYDSNPGPLGNESFIMANLNRNPVETKFDTGIQARATYQFNLTPSSSYTPLHITVLEPSFANIDKDPEVNRYYEDTALYNFQKMAQAAVNFNIDVSTNGAFGVKNIKLLFNTYFTLLNTIHACLSILAYSSDPTNRNDGLKFLRRQMTPDLYNSLQIAMETIAGTPVPPNIVAFSHWFYGNYTQSSHANSPVIKFLPVDVDSATTRFSNSMNKRILDSLDALKALRPTTAVLAKVVMRDKAWYQTPHYSSEVLHDEAFTTLFANAPYKVKNTESSKSYVRNELFQYITYGELDGGILGLTSKRIKVDTTNTLNLGLLTWPDLVSDTRWTIIDNNDSQGLVFTQSYNNINFAFSRGEISATYNNAASPSALVESPNYVRFGSQMVNQVSWTSVCENQRQMLVHLVGCDKIQLKTAKYDNNKGKRSK